MPDVVFELAPVLLADAIRNVLVSNLKCYSAPVLGATVTVTDIAVLAVQPVRGDFEWGPPNDPAPSILNQPGFLSGVQTPTVSTTAGPATVTTVASLLLVDVSMRLVQLNNSGEIATSPGQAYSLGTALPPITDTLIPVTTFELDPADPDDITSLVFQVSAAPSTSPDGVNLTFTYLGALGKNPSDDQAVAIVGLNLALKDSRGNPQPQTVNIPGPAGQTVANAGVAVPPWTAYGSQPPGIRLAVDLEVPPSAADWTAFYSGAGWTLPAGQEWSVAIGDTFIAAAIKTQAQAAINAAGGGVTIGASTFRQITATSWQSSLSVDNPAAGYLGDVLVDVTPVAGSPAAGSVSVTACVSFSESFQAELKAFLAGVLVGGAISNWIGGLVLGIVAAVGSAITLSQLISGKGSSGLAGLGSGAFGIQLSCAPDPASSCVICTATPDLTVQNVGTLEPGAFYGPEGYLALYGGTGQSFSIPAALLATLGAWQAYSVVPCQGLAGGSLPLTISNSGDLPALICSVTQRVATGSAPVLTWSVRGSAAAPAAPLMVPGGGVLPLSLYAPPSTSSDLRLTIATTAGCFELILPTPVPPAPTAAQEALGEAFARAMCTVLIDPLPVITSIGFTDPIEFEPGSVIQERVWATAAGLSDDGLLTARTQDGSLIATAPAVEGEATLTAAIPIAADYGTSHLSVQLAASGQPAGAESYARSLYKLRQVIDLHQEVVAAAQVGDATFQVVLAGGVLEGQVTGQRITWSAAAASGAVDWLTTPLRLRLREQSVRRAAAEPGWSRLTGSGGETVLEACDNGWLSSLVYDGVIAVEVQRKLGRILIWDELPTFVDLRRGFCVRLMDLDG